MSVSVSDLTVTKPWYPFLTSHLFGGTQDNCSQNIRFLSDLGLKIYPRNIRPNIGAHPGFAGVLVSGRRVVSVWNARLASLVKLGTALSYFTMPWRVWNTIHFPLEKCGGRS